MDLKIPVYEAKILGSDNTGIFAMSFVDLPANEQNFVALNKVRAKLSLDKQKQILTGAVLVPNQLIYRNDNALGEYYLRFTAQDIELIAQKMMRTGVALSTTTHQHESNLKDNYLVECWIVTDPKNDKSNALGLGELPKGTLIASYKVGSAAYWQTEVLAGKVKGFSIEGLFNFRSVKMNKPLIKTAAQMQKVAPKKAAEKKGLFMRVMEALLDGDTAAAVDDLADVAKEDETGSGEPFLVFDLQDGGEIDVDKDGFCTMAADGTQAPAGDHQLADGNFITIDDAGMLVQTAEEADAPAPTDAPAALSKAEQAKKDAARKEAKLRTAKLMKGESVKTPPATDPKSKEIAALKAKLAKLEAEPSVKKAAATSTTVIDAADDPSKMSRTQKMAAVLKLRQSQQSED